MISAGKGYDSAIIAQAADWHIASSNDGMDWDSFTVWLEADGRHRLAYDEVALTDRLLSENSLAVLQSAPALLEPVPEQPPTGNHPSPLRTRWLALSIAAAVAAVLVMVVGSTWMEPPQQNYITGAAPRTIVLADGSRVMLAPRSRLTISGGNADAMRLTGGAWFDVRHVAARELAISTGPITIRDIGTEFDVQEDGNLVRVAVKQGHVAVRSPALMRSIALDTGHALLFDGDRAVASVAATNLADIGGWRRDRLTYHDAPLALVADDLGRYAGIHLDVPAPLLSRRFSGTLIIGNGIEASRDLAQLTGLVLVRGRGGLRLAGRGNGASGD